MNQVGARIKVPLARLTHVFLLQMIPISLTVEMPYLDIVMTPSAYEGAFGLPAMLHEILPAVGPFAAVEAHAYEM
jgi:hypothetical protein